MKIIGLQAENVKRLKAINIEPDGTLQVIAGKNGQGKSSLLDSIFFALGGGDAAKTTTMPIRKGERKAKVVLDLGDITVTRTWTQGGTRLKVAGKDGDEYKSPQTLLDSLVGAIGFDPLEFTRMTAKKQKEMLLELLGIDLDDLDAERAKVYSKRTDLGRDLKALGEIVQVDEDAPIEERSAAELIEKIQLVRENNRKWRDVDADLGSLEVERDRLEARLAEIHIEIADSRAWLAENELVETAQLESDLSELEEYNRQARANAQAVEKALKASILNRKINKATRRLKAIDIEKQELIENADFPVEGLGFDEDGVILNGLPFEQASSAEQIKVSLGIGMALNPGLRVLMVKDGSLLDEDSMQAIRGMAGDNDFQLWIERVGTDDPVAVVIEDGEVVE